MSSLGPTQCPFLLIVQWSAETSAPRRQPTKHKYWSSQKRSYFANLRLEAADACLTSLTQPCRSYSDFACPTASGGLIPRIFYVNRFVGSLGYVVSSLVHHTGPRSGKTCRHGAPFSSDYALHACCGIRRGMLQIHQSRDNNYAAATANHC